jgi:hypothetical protein
MDPCEEIQVLATLRIAWKYGWALKSLKMYLTTFFGLNWPSSVVEIHLLQGNCCLPNIIGSNNINNNQKTELSL